MQRMHQKDFFKKKEQAAKAEDYDPTKDEREMGLFMKFVMFFCFCSC